MDFCPGVTPIAKAKGYWALARFTKRVLGPGAGERQGAAIVGAGIAAEITGQDGVRFTGCRKERQERRFSPGAKIAFATPEDVIRPRAAENGAGWGKLQDPERADGDSDVMLGPARIGRMVGT